uniref:Uncharacterized protein n=1 Tax=Junco hyemalis TaxID=40217 RepID=A0A8C5ITI4_JUNHY
EKAGCKSISYVISKAILSPSFPLECQMPPLFALSQTCWRQGFEQKMSRRGVRCILGLSPSAGKSKVSPKYIMLLNHHNNAKDLLESSAKK